MGKKQHQKAAFHLEGRFLRFEVEDGYKLKWLLLRTALGESRIKLTKEARASVDRVLMPGDWIQIWGEQSQKADAPEPKLKAYRIAVASPRSGDQPGSSEPKPGKSSKETILVCQKSDCMKRGGKAVCQALAATLQERGLEDQVSIRGTGCMKQCKAGPNLVMPGKTRYSKITAAEVPAMIDKHFPPPVAEPVPAPVAAALVISEPVML